MRSDLSQERTTLLADSLLLPECVYRPGSFSGLMVLYESNFLKISALIGDLDPGVGSWISRVTGDNDLFLETAAVESYTTTLRMTYRLRDSSGLQLEDPGLTVRLYHDTEQAEALSWRSAHRHRALRDLAATHAGELGRRWQRNMMLNKWLDYLIDCGHGFGT